MTNIIAEHKKLQAAVKLLAELAKGVESIRTEGLLTIDEAFAGLDGMMPTIRTARERVQ